MTTPLAGGASSRGGITRRGPVGECGGRPSSLPKIGHRRSKLKARTAPRLTPRQDPPRDAAERGFTLLEVMIALAILSVAIVACIQGFSQGLRLLKLAGDHQQAILLADEKAREIVTPTAGQEHGAEGRFRWERVIREVPMPELVVPGQPPPPWKNFEIMVRVQWDERRQVQVATLRMASTLETGQPPGARR